MRILYAGLILAVFHLGTGKDAAASWGDQCADYRQKELTLSELVGEATSISLYRATAAEHVNKTIFDGLEQEPTSYQFTLEAALKGTPSLQMQMLGGTLEKGIPAYFFSTLQRHSEIDAASVSNLGMALPIKLADSKKCKYVPSFKVGYSYLIFEGIESQISYEVILDTERDNWLKMVRDEIKRQQDAQ